MERVSVIIPNWNGKELLRTCLTSMRQQTYTDVRIYVVDNGSEDDSVQMLRSEFPEVEIIANQENLGFAGGVNCGIEASGGEYVFLLNNDTEAHPDWINEAVSIMDAQPEYGFAASKVLHFDNHQIIDSMGDGYGFAGLGFKIGHMQKDEGQFEEPFEVFGACGAASIYRRSMLDEIGLLDPDFFAYMEDVDLSIRARLAGYRCIAIPSAKIYHMISATTGGDTSEFSVKMTSKNVINILIKDIPATLLPKMLLLAFTAQITLIILSLVTNRHPGLRNNLPGYWKGLRMALREAPKMLKKRKQMQKLRKITTSEFAAMIRESQTQKRVYR